MEATDHLCHLECVTACGRILHMLTASCTTACGRRRTAPSNSFWPYSSMQTLVGGKHGTKSETTSGHSHLWEETNMEPKLELPVDTVTCGRRQTWNQNWNYQWIQSLVGGDEQSYQCFETLLQRTWNTAHNIIRSLYSIPSNSKVQDKDS